MSYANKDNRGVFIVSLVLFLLVFNPPIIGGFSFTVLLVILSAYYCIINRKKAYEVYKCKKVKKIIVAFVLFAGYNLFFSIANFFRIGNDDILNNIVSFFVDYISLIVVSTAIVVYMINGSRNLYFLIYSYVCAGFYQTILAIMCLILPPVKNIFNSLTISNSGSEKISRIVENSSEFRNYGFASTLYDIFGMAMSVLAILTITLGFKGDKKCFVLAVLITVAAVINARSSFILIALGFLIIFFSVKDKMNTRWIMTRILLVLVMICSIVLVFTWILDNQTSAQLVWLASAITETIETNDGEAVGYYDTLFNEFIFFPQEMFSFLFGTSMSSLQAIDEGTDVGYVQNVWNYGIFGSFLLYSFYFKLFKYPIQLSSWPESKMFKAILIMIAIYLVKLSCFGYSMASVIFVPLCLYALYESSINNTSPLKNGRV